LNLLCSCTEYGYGYIWDINEIKTISEFNTEKYPKGVMWSPNGNFIGICSKNGKLDIFDKKEKILENIISDRDISIKNFDWLDEQNIVTVGWEKDEQKIKLWDLRNKTNCFEELIITNKNDGNDINLFVNLEMKLIYTVRKEVDIKSNPSMIVYNLNENKKLEKIYEHETDYPGSCTVLLKNNLEEKKNNEINIFVRYSSKENKIYYVSFISKNEIKIYLF
jgi:WD40 repeat protein